ncbi:hypothetical protein DY000_02048813 [Brassica cretica]|uniref:Uncharacterized protein n=1 Tax=Brassica cretica TaxID=69181 RepID=A0ABQ7F725_BRACR|nr:hypothetical protein DY000_02048813 [Brassica cretica]
MRCKPLYTPSFPSSRAEKGNIHIVRYSGRSSKVARPGRKGNFVKRNKGQRCPLQDVGSQESLEEIIETLDSVLHDRFKEPEETLPRYYSPPDPRQDLDLWVPVLGTLRIPSIGYPGIGFRNRLQLQEKENCQ